MTYISTGKVIDPSTTVQYVSYITQGKNMEERIYASIKYVLTLYISTIAKHASTSSLNKKMYIGWENYVSPVTLIHGNLNNK